MLMPEELLYFYIGEAIIYTTLCAQIFNFVFAILKFNDV